MPNEVHSVLAHYPPEFRAKSVASLGSAGGFSGAQFWRLESATGELCLRRWPVEHPTEDRLRLIHAVLRHVQRQGFGLAAAPLETRKGTTFVRHRGHLWELSPWMPGTADYHDRPSTHRLRAALAALAEFHAAAATYEHRQAVEAPSPGIRSRRERLEHLISGGLAELGQHVQRHAGFWPELAERARRLSELFPRVAPGVMQSLASAEPRAVGQQPCIRDIWHDHVLFEGDRVTGLVDFGAMRVDNVATDVARLLGSLARDDDGGWREGLSAYQSVRPLSADERELVRAFDHSTVLLSGFNWVEWVFRDKRTFEQREIILRRVDSMLQRCSALTMAE